MKPLAALLLLRLSATATEISRERVPEDGLKPQAAVSADGTVHPVYLTGKPESADIRYVRHGDGNDVERLQLTAPPQPESSGFSIVPQGQSGAGPTVMSGTAAPSAHCSVEACTSFVSRDPIDSFDATAAGSFRLTDIDAMNHPRRFYRIILPPAD